MGMARRSWFKVVQTDNFARETVDEVVLIQMLDEACAKQVVDVLNSYEDENSSRFFRAYPQDQPLYKFEP